MHKGRRIPNERRPIRQQLERHRRMADEVSFDKVPEDEAAGADDEGREDVGRVPGEGLAAPDETDDEQAVVSGVSGEMEEGRETYVMEGMKMALPVLRAKSKSKTLK
jgi:hypothetical protein